MHYNTIQLVSVQMATHGGIVVEIYNVFSPSARETSQYNPDRSMEFNYGFLRVCVCTNRRLTFLLNFEFHHENFIFATVEGTFWKPYVPTYAAVQCSLFTNNEA